MSFHHAYVQWHSTQPFSHNGYNKDHTAQISDQTLNLSSANTEGFIDPEQALAASLASCHMLTFLAVCAKKRLQVKSYQDTCVAQVKENSEGKFYVDNIQLNPQVVFEPNSAVQTLEQLEHIHQKAHAHCFISNSLTSRVDINIKQG